MAQPLLLLVCGALLVAGGRRGPSDAPGGTGEPADAPTAAPTEDETLQNEADNQENVLSQVGGGPAARTPGPTGPLGHRVRGEERLEPSRSPTPSRPLRGGRLRGGAVGGRRDGTRGGGLSAEAPGGPPGTPGPRGEHRAAAGVMPARWPRAEGPGRDPVSWRGRGEMHTGSPLAGARGRRRGVTADSCPCPKYSACLI